MCFYTIVLKHCFLVAAKEESLSPNRIVQECQPSSLTSPLSVLVSYMNVVYNVIRLSFAVFVFQWCYFWYRLVTYQFGIHIKILYGSQRSFNLSDFAGYNNTNKANSVLNNIIFKNQLHQYFYISIINWNKYILHWIGFGILETQLVLLRFLS